MTSSLSRLLLACCLLTFVVGPYAQAQPTPHWPNWTVPTSQGREFSSRALEGKVVVVSVWASWCSSCRRQLPLLSQLQRSHANSDLQVVSFSFDHSTQQHDSYLEDLDVPFPAIFARSGPGLAAVKLLQDQAGPLEAVPTLMVFDRDGKLVHRSVGYATLGRLEELVGPLLPEVSADAR